MRIAVVIVVFLLAAACATAPQPCVETVIELQQVPRLGDRLPNLRKSCTQTFAASAQTWPSYDVVVGANTFTVGVDKDVVRFISTHDKSFASPEGLHVDDPMAAAVAAAPGKEVMEEMGWGNYIELPSGWYAFIDDTRWVDGKLDLNLGTRPLRSDAWIAMFFMRN